MLADIAAVVLPQVPTEIEALIRISYGLMLLLFLLFALPQARRFFVSESWQGYTEVSRVHNLIQNPVVLPVLLVGWCLLALGLISGLWSPWLALLNLILCRYYFVAMRWKSLTRGFGAPGFMNYWLGAVVFGLEFSRHYFPAYHGLTLYVAQLDFALIMLSAGVYKWRAGYPQNNGMELGMVNPAWGYWWRFYRHFSPRHPLFYLLNQLAWSLEVLASLLMLFPASRFWGGLLILLSFVFILSQIRLGTLCYVVIISSLLFFESGSWGAELLLGSLPALWPSTAPAWQLPAILAQAYALGLTLYLLLLPLTHAGLWLNFYARWRLPGRLQAWLEAYSNFFGIIIWRVFSADLTHFYLQIYQQQPDLTRVLISDYARLKVPRFNHVVESIALTSIFTTLKYFPANSALFQQKLLRYAKTLPAAQAGQLIFEYRIIEKTASHFHDLKVAEFVVNCQSGEIKELTFDSQHMGQLREAQAHSPLKAGIRPGVYLPDTQA